MTSADWINYAKVNAPKLRSLLREWHPRSAFQANDARRSDFQITAPGAEAICAHIRTQEAKKYGSPLQQFDKALEASDIGTLMSLLNGAWFGVPESQGCWTIEGFREAVELLEDPPEEEQ